MFVCQEKLNFVMTYMKVVLTIDLFIIGTLFELLLILREPTAENRPHDYKAFFEMNSAEHEI